MRRRRQVRIAHAEIDDVGAGVAGRRLGAVDLLEHVGRQAADAVKFFHRSISAKALAARERLEPVQRIGISDRLVGRGLVDRAAAGDRDRPRRAAARAGFFGWPAARRLGGGFCCVSRAATSSSSSFCCSASVSIAAGRAAAACRGPPDSASWRRPAAPERRPAGRCRHVGRACRRTSRRSTRSRQAPPRRSDGRKPDERAAPRSAVMRNARSRRACRHPTPTGSATGIREDAASPVKMA